MKKLIIISILILTGCASWSTGDKILLGTSILATYADYRTTVDLLDRGGHENMGAWATGKYPSHKDMALYLISTETITIILAHYLPKYRKAILGAKTILNTGCAIHNSDE